MLFAFAFPLRFRSSVTQEVSFGKDSVLNNKPFDLHVLGTPPAFVLSQDQTLHKIL